MKRKIYKILLFIILLLAIGTIKQYASTSGVIISGKEPEYEKYGQAYKIKIWKRDKEDNNVWSSSDYTSKAKYIATSHMAGTNPISGIKGGSIDTGYIEIDGSYYNLIESNYVYMQFTITRASSAKGDNDKANVNEGVKKIKNSNTGENEKCLEIINCGSKETNKNDIHRFDSNIDQLITFRVCIKLCHGGSFTYGKMVTFEDWGSIKVGIKFNNVKSKEQIYAEKAADAYGTYIKDNNATKTKVESGTHKFSGKTTEDKVKNFIKSYGIKISSQNSKIKFEDDTEIKTYQKINGLEFTFTPKENIVVYTTLQPGSTGSNRKKTEEWKKFPLTKNKKYTVVFNFVYSKVGKFIKYQAFWKDYKYRKYAIEEANESATNAEEELEEAERVYKQIKSIVDLANKEQERDKVEFTDALTDTDYYSKTGDISSSDAKKITNKLSTILSVITTIGIVSSVIILAAIGIKYILGSLEERAEYKKDMIPYVVGLTLLLSVTTVVKIIISLGNSINNI